jgi:NADPH-dependent glutamate synthase beta subunit-like oxidoreductase
VRGCPAHNDIPSFIAIRDHDLGKAHDVLRLTSVLPDVCSRVCDQAAQCEGACTWSLAGGTPVAIGKLERFVTDHAPVPKPAGATAGAASLSVGVVGSGPAGIGTAWQLVEAGAAVTVYEREPEPGGLLGWGIPAFTLPPSVAARPWRQLTAAGVDLRCQAGVGPEDIDRLLAEHDAVILAHGAGLPLRLPVPGGDLDGVTDATSFLRAGRAALAGGGADIDRFRSRYGRCAAPAARTSQKLAAQRPKVRGDEHEVLGVDLVVMAMGYRNDPAFAATLPGTPVARVAKGLPFQDRVWAAGDALVGPSTVVEAMAQGRRAADAALRARPSRGPRPEPRRVLVAYESRGGRTARAARLVADRLRGTGAVVRAVPLSQAWLAELTDTDLLVVGTWVEGLVLARVRAARATRAWLADLPRLAGLRTATFCTFAVSPAASLAGMRQALEERGAVVVAEGTFGPGARDIAENAAVFAETLLTAAWPGERGTCS